jgi:hypothetical protein
MQAELSRLPAPEWPSGEANFMRNANGEKATDSPQSFFTIPEPFGMHSRDFHGIALGQ